MGFNDGSKSVLYYNPETRRILTSRNFQFLVNLPKDSGMPEPLIVDLPPTVPCEGEHDRGSNMNTLQPGSQQQSINKTKGHNEEPDESNKSSKRKLRTKLPVNYRDLNDPFSDEEEEMNHENPATTYQATLGTEDPKTVNETK